MATNGIGKAKRKWKIETLKKRWKEKIPNDCNYDTVEVNEAIQICAGATKTGTARINK